MKNIIIIGSRGYEHNYGGWETFVTELVNNSQDMDIKYYIPNLTHDKKEDKKITKRNNIEIINLYTKKMGFPTMFIFTIKSIMYYIKYLRKNKLKNTVMLILGSKIGPLMPLFYTQLRRRGCKVVMNPDGLEWKRDKWNAVIKKGAKVGETLPPSNPGEWQIAVVGPAVTIKENGVVAKGEMIG